MSGAFDENYDQADEIAGEDIPHETTIARVGVYTFLTAADLKLGPLAPLRKLIDQPQGHDGPRDSYACAGHMVRRGYTDAQIIGVLMNPANAVHAHIGAQQFPQQAAQQSVEIARTDLRKQANGHQPNTSGISLTDFYAYMPMHNYIYVPTRETWPATSVNSRIPPMPLLDASGDPVIDDKGNPKTLQAAAWLDRERHVEQMTWAPGAPLVVLDRLISDGGWIDQPDAACFNLYRASNAKHGDALLANRWVQHIRRIYPSDADHIIKWLAHRVQRPDQKINHAIVLGGNQGIGKDTILEPVKYAIGPWNFAEVSPQHMLGRFNGFVKSVILRVSESRDLGDVDRFAFYDHMKTYTAAPPDVIRVDEKHLREYSVFNVCGVIITTNHKSDGIYLPADDRRHFVAWSDVTRDSFTPDYWNALYDWYQNGGNQHVTAYLATLDLSDFNPKAPPPKTEAFWSIVDANRVPEDAELADALDKLGNPDATTLDAVAGASEIAFGDWLKFRGNSRKVPHRMEECGYVAERNPAAKDGLWRVGGKRAVVYVRKELSPAARRTAAENTGYHTKF